MLQKGFKMKSYLKTEFGSCLYGTQLFFDRRDKIKLEFNLKSQILALSLP